jgi:hypothetical protein
VSQSPPGTLTPLPSGAGAALLLAFGAITSGLILWGGDVLPQGSGRAVLLLFASSLAALLTALLWLAWLGLRQGGGWALVWAIGIWIPYVNLVIASVYARRYWSAGARAPALLALAGLIGQTILALLLAVVPAPLLV